MLKHFALASCVATLALFSSAQAEEIVLVAEGSGWDAVIEARCVAMYDGDIVNQSLVFEVAEVHPNISVSLRLIQGEHDLYLGRMHINEEGRGEFVMEREHVIPECERRPCERINPGDVPVAFRGEHAVDASSTRSRTRPAQDKTLAVGPGFSSEESGPSCARSATVVQPSPSTFGGLVEAAAIVLRLQLQRCDLTRPALVIDRDESAIGAHSMPPLPRADALALNTHATLDARAKCRVDLAAQDYNVALVNRPQKVHRIDRRGDHGAAAMALSRDRRTDVDPGHHLAAEDAPE